MKVLEIYKKDLKEIYDGNISLYIGCKDGVIYDDERIYFFIFLIYITLL
nr:MAG TPA: hypothetical protein [Caudoviricetes sp.]